MTMKILTPRTLSPIGTLPPLSMRGDQRKSRKSLTP